MPVSRCPGCGVTFGCGADEAWCWCAQQSVSPEILAALRTRGDTCLCPQCLAQAAAGPVARPAA